GPRPHAAIGRRWLIRSLVAAGVVSVVGIGAWMWMQPAPPTIALGVVEKESLDAEPALAGVAEFPAFRNGAAVKKPATMITDNLKGGPQQLDDRDVAVYFFTIRGVQGRLIVIRKAAVIDPPTATSFSTRTIRYGAGYCATAWVEGQFVYVCCVKGGGDLLDK